MSMENVLIELTTVKGNKFTLCPADYLICEPREQEKDVNAVLQNDKLQFHVKESYESIVTALEKAGYGIIRVAE